jgi:hypothetical protein
VLIVANLQIKGIQDELYGQIKQLAASENRSVAQQILFLVKDYLARKEHVSRNRTSAQVLLELSGSWDDEREAEEVISEVKKARRNSTKLSQGF